MMIVAYGRRMNGGVFQMGRKDEKKSESKKRWSKVQRQGDIAPCGQATSIIVGKLLKNSYPNIPMDACTVRNAVT